jgi:hypothetical protein
MLQLIGFFAALFAGGGAVGAVLGAVLGATLGRVLHRAKRPLNTAGHAIGVGLAAPIYAEYVGLGPVAPDWLFWVGVTLVAFLLHRFEGNWWWLGPCLALATAAVTGRLMGLY